MFLGYFARQLYQSNNSIIKDGNNLNGCYTICSDYEISFTQMFIFYISLITKIEQNSKGRLMLIAGLFY